MTIGIVTNYSSKNPAGLERFIIELIKNFTHLNNKNQYIIYTNKKSDIEFALIDTNKNKIEKDTESYNSTSLNRNENKFSPPLSLAKIKIIKIGFGKLWKHIGLLFTKKSDVYIFNGPLVPLFFSPENYYPIIYDFAYKYIAAESIKEKFKNFIMDILTKIALKRAKQIITISNASKNDIIKFFKIPENKISVIYPGFNDFSKIPEKPIKNISQKYFLFVGTIKKRKNILTIIKAFSLFIKNYSNEYNLILTGKLNSESAYYKHLINFIINENLINKVFFTNHVTDNELAFLYKHATALIYPSVIEGFGFPVLEAMSCNLPVITSNTTSLKEIAENAALLINPLNEKEICQAMANIISNNKLKQNLIFNGKERIKQFSWDKMAKSIIQLLNQ